MNLGVCRIYSNDLSQNHESVGTNKFQGDYIIIFDQLPYPPEQAQSPYGATSANQVSGQYTANAYVFENFWNIPREINKVIWWGLTLKWDGKWILGNPDEMNFDIEFFNDDDHPENAPPSEKIKTYEVASTELLIDHTGRFYALSSGDPAEMIRFEYELPSPVNVTQGNGWVRIWSHDDPRGNIFLWVRSDQGDHHYYHENWDNLVTTSDRAFQLYEALKDETPPKVVIERPQESTVYLNDYELFQWFFTTLIIGYFEIRFSASDVGEGIDYIALFINDELQTIFMEEPYKWTWDDFGFGVNKLIIRAYDNAGNVAEEELIVIKIL
jgi:hypothetical protein